MKNIGGAIHLRGWQGGGSSVLESSALPQLQSWWGSGLNLAMSRQSNLILS